MTEHTTIQITKAQADELQARKTHDDESYKSVLARLLEQETGEIDYAEIESRCERAVESVVTGQQR